jgi:YidC/Oxa1 family membrane protein insertase
MDFQRYLLIGSIAALSFMLLTEWVQFKEQKSGRDVVAAYQQQSTSSPSFENTEDSVKSNTFAEIDNSVDIPTFDQPVTSNDINESKNTDRKNKN